MKNEYPRVSGHEVLGEIEKLGDGVDPIKFKIGHLVGVGWYDSLFWKSHFKKLFI